MSTDNPEVQLPDPPHGGRFVRNADGSLECTHFTKPAASISDAPAVPAATTMPAHADTHEE